MEIGGEADSSPQKCTLVIMPWLEINMKQKKKTVFWKDPVYVKKNSEMWNDFVVAIFFLMR